MTALSAIAHQTGISDSLSRLNDRILAVLHDDRSLAVRGVLSRISAITTGVAIVVAVYLATTIMFFAPAHVAHVCG